MIAPATSWRLRALFTLPSKSALAMAAILLWLCPAAVQAANVLVNPGMESGLNAGWTCYGRTGQEGWYSYALATVPDPTVSGNNAFKVYAGWNGDPNYNGTFQDVACLATTVFTASGWFRTKGTDQIIGTWGAGTGPDSGNTCWIEVTFRDAANNVLALYKSAVFDGAWTPDTWFAMPVTNACDLVTGLPTAQVTTLVAPDGTKKVRYQIVLKQSAWAGAGALWVDDMVLDQVSGPAAPTIGSVSPGALLLADATQGLSFTVNSISGTTINSSGIQVVLNGTDISANLNISGTASSKSVSYTALQPNKSYAVSIQVTDTLGLASTSAFSFDTLVPTFIWEGEDYDFGGGLFINHPVLSSTPEANSYFGQVAVENVDVYESTGEGDKLYRSSDRMATTVSGDIPRKSLQNAQAVDPAINDYKIGWFNTGEWVNYTRNFPAGTYNVYARLAGGQGAATVTLSKVTAGAGTTAQTLSTLGTFSFVGSSWSTYQYVPLRDTFGNLVEVSANGLTTLRVTTGGGADVNFLMLVAPDRTHPVITGAYPDGTMLLQGTNAFRFGVASSASPISSSGIGLLVNGVDVSSKLTITGTANEKTVTYSGLLLNSPNYTVTLGVTNDLGLAASSTLKFDTFNPSAYTWEAEDYDFGSGQYIDNPQTNGYYGFTGVLYTDFNESFELTGAKWVYRADEMSTDVSGDTPRLRSVGTNDFNVGWFTAGEWLNFSRHYPAGQYYVYGRFARGTGTNAAPTLSRVTSGVGTPTQTTIDLGTFPVVSHGWGTFIYSQLKNAEGQPVVLSPDGSLMTLRLTSAGPETSTEANVNFLILVPVPHPVTLHAALTGGNVVLSFATEVGISYQVQYKDNLSDSGWSDLGISVIGNGTVQSVTQAANASPRVYRLQIQ
jgi:hypothetical protein